MSPTVNMEGTLLTAVISAQDCRDIATCDIPMHLSRHLCQTIMKIIGVCVDILCETDPIYWGYMVTEGNQKVLYLHIT